MCNKSSPSRMRCTGESGGKLTLTKSSARQPPLLGFSLVDDSLLGGSRADMATRPSGRSRWWRGSDWGYGKSAPIQRLCVYAGYLPSLLTNVPGSTRGFRLTILPTVRTSVRVMGREQPTPPFVPNQRDPLYLPVRPLVCHKGRVVFKPSFRGPTDTGSLEEKHVLADLPERRGFEIPGGFVVRVFRVSSIRAMATLSHRRGRWINALLGLAKQNSLPTRLLAHSYSLSRSVTRYPSIQRLGSPATTMASTIPDAAFTQLHHRLNACNPSPGFDPHDSMADRRARPVAMVIQRRFRW